MRRATVCLDKEAEALTFLSKAREVLCGLPISPVGSSPWGSPCYAFDEVGGAIRQAAVSPEEEEEILTLFSNAHGTLCGR